MSKDYLKALTNEKAREAGERYGIKHSDYGFGRPGGGGIQKKNPKDYGKDVADAAMNDYDTRRTIEAAAMSGKKKAEKYAKNGFSDLTDVTKANNMFAKMHKRHGNGGDFSSNSDYAGLTYDMVQRDREKLKESFSAQSPDDEQTNEAITPTDTPTDYTESEETVKARETVKAWQDSNLGGDVYGTNSTSYATSAFEKEKQRAVTTNVDEFVANYKNDVYKGAKMRPNIPI